MVADDDAHAAAVAEAALAPYLALVEEHNLCPWARPARLAGEVRVAVRWWRGDVDELAARLGAALRAWDDDARMGVGLAVVPDLPLSPASWRRVRDQVAALAPRYALADFHPDAPYVADDAARVVGLLRRAPWALVQAVPHAALRALSRPPELPSAARQAAILADPFAVAPAPADPRDQIAETNLATVRRIGVEALAARLTAIRADAIGALAALDRRSR